MKNEDKIINLLEKIYEEVKVSGEKLEKLDATIITKDNIHREHVKLNHSLETVSRIQLEALDIQKVTRGKLKIIIESIDKIQININIIKYLI